MRQRPPPPPDAAPPRRPWSLAGLLDLVLTLITTVLISWLASLLLEGLGMALGWWDVPGAGHSQQLLEVERAGLQRDFSAPETVSRLLRWTDQGAMLAYHWSGLEAVVRWLVADTPPAWPGLGLLRAGLLGFGEYLLAAAYTTQLVGARLAVVLLSLPAFAVASLMGLIDGLVRRDLRRFGGGGESSFMYHHLKKALRPTLWGPITLYLASPWSLQPTVVFVPAALLLGYFVQRTVSRFKKYL